MHPLLIATVALVGLPIVIHLLLKQQPKRLLFPAIRFLVQTRKSSQRKLRLRHLLLLALRVLVIALFGLALYQPKLLSQGLNLAAESPVRWIAVSFASGTPCGSTTQAGTPTSCAAKATPWPWLPADAVTTPAARDAGSSWRIAFSAPRILNAPVRCRFSSLR